MEKSEEDFYSMFERINANALSEKDMKRFIAAMKEVSLSVQYYRSVIPLSNFSDMETLNLTVLYPPSYARFLFPNSKYHIAFHLFLIGASGHGWCREFR